MPRLTIFCHLSLIALVGIGPTSIYTEDVVVIVSHGAIEMVRSRFWFGREIIHGLGPIAIGLEPALHRTVRTHLSLMIALSLNLRPTSHRTISPQELPFIASLASAG